MTQWHCARRSLITGSSRNQGRFGPCFFFFSLAVYARMSEISLASGTTAMLRLTHTLSIVGLAACGVMLSGIVGADKA